MSPTLNKAIKVMNSQGLHARPASLFVRMANKFDSDITVMKDGEAVNGKSIMGILTLAVEQGCEVSVVASGVDAEEALRELELFLQSPDEPKEPEANA